MVALYAYSLGHSPQEISLIIASSALLPAIFALQIGKWADHYGTRPLVIIGNIMFIVALLLSAIYPTFITFLIQLAMIGVASTCLMICLQKRIGSLSGEIDRLIANYSLFGSIGAMVGPVMISYLYEHYSYQICIFFNVSLIAIAMSSEMFMRNVNVKTNEISQANILTKESIWSLMRNRDMRNAMIIGGLLFSNRELFSVYFPLLAENKGISPTMTGTLLSFSALTMLIIRFTQTSIVRSFGRMKILTWSLLVTAIIYLIIPFSHSIVLLFLLIGILGAGLGLAQPLSTSAVLEISLPERRGEILGAQMTINRTSQLAIPLIFGGIGGLMGVSAIFCGSGLVLVVFGYMTRPVSTNINQTNRHGKDL